MNIDSVQILLEDKQVISANPGRDFYRMDAYLRKYIDSNIVREHLTKSVDGYSLDIQDIPEHDKQSLAELLIKKDPIAQEWIENRMADLIEERLYWAEVDDKSDLPLFMSYSNEPNYL